MVRWVDGSTDSMDREPQQVDLPFQPRWRAKVVAGQKTTTVRTKRYGAPGDTFDVDGLAFRLVAVDAMRLGSARDRVWREEGMTSPAHFESVWVENHPTRGFRPDDQVWVHVFTRILEED